MTDSERIAALEVELAALKAQAVTKPTTTPQVKAKPAGGRHKAPVVHKHGSTTWRPWQVQRSTQPKAASGPVRVDKHVDGFPITGRELSRFSGDAVNAPARAAVVSDSRD